MQPVLTPAEMAHVDQEAPESLEVLVRRAATAVASAAVHMLGGTYGRRVAVVAGPGNNGADGRVAAALLERRGVRCTVWSVDDAPAVLPPCDLVIDAAFGTGFRGSYVFPDVGGAPVLAVDVPSGVSGATGVVSGVPARAQRTVTFAAWKPGLLLGDGPELSGGVHVADIGLDVSAATAFVVEPADVAQWVGERRVDAHKWQHAVAVVAGSPGMTGAAVLTSMGALRSGAGYVRLSVPGSTGPTPGVPLEVVEHRVAAADVAGVVAGLDRFASVVVGPGLGRTSDAQRLVAGLVAQVDLPMVVDGDGLHHLGARELDLLAVRTAPTVLTPHDGEFAALTGAAPGTDRIGAVRALARATGAVVLLKGPTTIAAKPSGVAYLVRSADQRLATAGTGDVLAGVLGALLALGGDPLEVAAAAAFIHGTAAMLGYRRGLIASDVAALVPAAVEIFADSVVDLG
ncbi:MAG: NAD(P)H-hydrate dehydratase [Actinomycetes bacterium]